MEHEPVMGRIIAVANQKGGVGKTTTAINLGASLAFKSRRCLIIDFDPQGMATAGLGQEKTGQRGIYPVLMNGCGIMDHVQGTDVCNLLLCPCSPEMAGFEAELFPQDNRESRLKNVLETVRSRFHFILIDCPPSLSFLTINAMAAADSILITVQTEFFCMEGMPELFRTLGEVRTYLNPGLKIEGILLTMFDERTNLSKQVAAEIRSSLQGIVFDTVIPRTVKLAEAPSFGQPALIYDFNSKGTQAYLRLAEEILTP